MSRTQVDLALTSQHGMMMATMKREEMKMQQLIKRVERKAKRQSHLNLAKLKIKPQVALGISKMTNRTVWMRMKMMRMMNSLSKSKLNLEVLMTTKMRKTMMNQKKK